MINDIRNVEKSCLMGIISSDIYFDPDFGDYVEEGASKTKQTASILYPK